MVKGLLQVISTLLVYTLQAIAGLNGMQLGDKKLVVQRASVGSKTPLMEALEAGMGMPQPINIPGLHIEATAQSATEVLCLMNMVNKDELEDDEEYEGVSVCLYVCMTSSAIFNSFPSSL